MFYTAWKEKKLHGLVMPGSGISGNAATRVESFIYSKGSYAYGGYPDIDALFEQQAKERDTLTREALVHRLQALTIERVVFAPVYDLRDLMGIGHRVAEHMIHSVPLHPSGMLDDIRLRE